MKVSIRDYEILAQRPHARMKLRRRRKFVVMFHVEVSGLEADDKPSSLSRRFKTFKRLHSMVRRQFPRSTLPPLPSFLYGRFDDGYVTSMCSQLHDYMQQLLALPEVHDSDALRSFLDEMSCSDADEEDRVRSRESALLAVYDFQVVRLKKAQAFELVLPAQKPNSVIVWEFRTRKNDIGFQATFDDVVVLPYRRCASHVRTIHGTFEPGERVGTCRLTWDNSYSWRRGKTLSYRAAVLDETAIERALEAANLSEEDAETMAFDADEHDHARSQHVEQGVGSTIKAAKFKTPNARYRLPPFKLNRRASPSGTVEDAGDQMMKAGSLLLQCRGRLRVQKHWVKHWFVLDIRNGTLTCYKDFSSSSLAQKRLVRKKRLNLKRSNAFLSVGSTRPAPAPFILHVRAGRRQQHICAETEGEYHSWREAISASIHYVRWNQTTNTQRRSTDNAKTDEGLLSAAIESDSEDDDDDDEEEDDEYHHDDDDDEDETDSEESDSDDWDDDNVEESIVQSFDVDPTIGSRQLAGSAFGPGHVVQQAVSVLASWHFAVVACALFNVVLCLVWFGSWHTSAVVAVLLDGCAIVFLCSSMGDASSSSSSDAEHFVGLVGRLEREEHDHGHKL